MEKTPIKKLIKKLKKKKKKRKTTLTLDAIPRPR
jgi:hypothetical protein